MKAAKTLLLRAGCACLWLLICITAVAQGSSFTYQGRLADGGAPANGVYDFRFTLFDTVTGGPAAIAGPVTNSTVVVSNGLFSTTMDFGAAAFNGADRWLEIAVRSDGAAGFVTLAYRQHITASPYSIQSLNAATATVASSAGAVAARNITGTIGLSQLPTVIVTNGASGVNISGTFTGNGGSLTNIPLTGINSYGAFAVVTNGLNFMLSSTPAAGFQPYHLAAADINGDSKPDVITLNLNTGMLTVLTNNGGGILSSNAAVPSGPGAVGIMAADINGDGKPDLITLNETYPSCTLTILTNDGNGVFGSNSTQTVGNSADGLAAADVNGDGRMDLITANYNDHALRVLLNNGDGTFGTSIFPVGRCPDFVLATNISGGARPDLICANTCDNTLTILTNNGSGLFGSNATLNVGSSPDYVIATDVNGDGALDLVCGHIGGNTLTVLTNNRAGAFALSVTLQPADNLTSVVGADVNGDGKMDLISPTAYGRALTILTNDGRGNFSIGANLTRGLAGGNFVCAADLNGDGKVDLIAANNNNNTLAVFTNATGQLSTEFVTALQSGGLRLSDSGGEVSVINGSRANQIIPGSEASTIGGGDANSINIGYATISGGQSNVVSGVAGTVGGGQFNTNNSGAGFIGGGQYNFVSGDQSTIGGGWGNIATIEFSTVGGGYQNRSTGDTSTVGGGENNFATNSDSVVGGGGNNLAGGVFATVAGGYGNTSGNYSSTVGGGFNNQSLGYSATVGGGNINNALGDYSTVPGGKLNAANGQYATVGGGWGNIASNYATTIAGGQNNTNNGTAGFIGGGQNNAVSSGFQPTIGGGFDNVASTDYATVGGGWDNAATGLNSTVPGGAHNRATGTGSFAAGQNAKALHDGAFVWADSLSPSFSSTGTNQFLIRAQGGVGIDMSSPIGGSLCIGTNTHLFDHPLYIRGLNGQIPDHNHGLAYNGNGVTNFGTGQYQVDGPVLFGYAGGVLGTRGGGDHVALQWNSSSVSVYGTFNNNSDRNAKQDFEKVTPSQILDKVTQLPVSQWSYKVDSKTRHIGPMAQDFYSVFNVGTDERHIAPIDEGGVALAAIQGLNQKLTAELKRRDAENAELRARLEKLERVIGNTSAATPRP